MNFIKDLSPHMKEGGKNTKRRGSYFSCQYNMKTSLISQVPERLNKSITKLRIKKNLQKMKEVLSKIIFIFINLDYKEMMLEKLQ